MFNEFRTYQLAKQFRRQCMQLHFKGAMRDQLERAVLSIVLNLAEGSGKPTARDRRRFYSIAMGSLREVQALLDLDDRQHELEQADSLAASLFRLIQNPGGTA